MIRLDLFVPVAYLFVCGLTDTKVQAGRYESSRQSCTIAVATNAKHAHLRAIMLDADYCVEKAEQCFRLARLANSPNVELAEIVSHLEAIGHELMAKAVELETVRQRGRRKH